MRTVDDATPRRRMYSPRDGGSLGSRETSEDESKCEGEGDDDDVAAAKADGTTFA
jgi:hypothetical protein